MMAYTIATIENTCYGHGSYENVERICRTGSYDSGPFPPVFADKQKAEEYKKTMQWPSNKVIVVVEVIL